MNKRDQMEQLLANTRAALSSAPTSNNYVTLNKVILPVIRRVMPKLIAEDIIGVQPMTAPAMVRAEELLLDDLCVVFNRFIWGDEQKEIDEWCEANLVGPVSINDDKKTYRFTNQVDAVLFWLNYR